MASSSSSASSIQKSFKYEVYVSFMGADTRKSFVDPLYRAFRQRRIITYKDDEQIKKGERIDDKHLRSIEESKFHIIVFSKNYASASWCLDELVKIMECQKTREHSAYAIFYDVKRTEVRNQSGTVGLAFAELKKRNKEDTGRWRRALEDVADLDGMELKNMGDGREAGFIEKVLEDISQLHFISFSLSDDSEGLKSSIQEVTSILRLRDSDVFMLGIWGIRGTGKTTLTRAVFDRISSQFDCKSFVMNVRKSSREYGFKELQKRVLRDLLNDQSIDLESVYEGKHVMKKMMFSKRVLLALCDVDGVGLLHALAGDATWFGPGSRVIITTKNEYLLRAHQVKVKYIYEVRFLNLKEGSSLFNKYAFRSNNLNQGYEDLSGELLRYTDGHPLLIKLLGSNLHGRTKHEWEYVTETLQASPNVKFSDLLRVIFTDLKNNEKEIFLDVAFILNDEMEDKAIRILESCGFDAQTGLSSLVEKYWITISNEGRLVLHDIVAELGMRLACRNDSRLWRKEEIEFILGNDLGTKDTRSIKVVDTNLNPNTIMKGLKKMKKLRLIYVDSGYEAGEYMSRSSYNIDGLPDSLRYLYWRNYPFRCLPRTFQASELVGIEMVGSNISQLWEGGEKKVLHKLRFLNLSYSKLTTFDIGLTPCLEELHLKGCKDLAELHVPRECPKLKYLNVSGSKLSNINLGLAPHLEELHLAHCKSLRDIPKSISMMKCLRRLHLPYCILVEKLPDKLEGLKYLKELNIEGTRISRLPDSIFLLKCLCIVWAKRRIESYGFTSLTEISSYTASGYV